MKKHVLFFLSFCLTLVISAQSPDITNIESGKVYQIKNVGKPGYSMSASTSSPAAVGAIYNPLDLKQQWYIFSNTDETGFYIRNVFTGAYLTSPNQLYMQWPLSYQSVPQDNIMSFTITDYENHKIIRAKSNQNGYGYAHCDGYNSIVCWTPSSEGTQWDLELIPYTDEEVNHLFKILDDKANEIASASLYERYLENLFNDKACTNPKTIRDYKTDLNYIGLSPILQSMVDKSFSGNWAEESGDWDSFHAKKYRIQLYEPYSEGNSAANFAGIQPYTNMNNPTGIVADEGDFIYIMVDEEPAEGSTLYIGVVPDCNMYNNATAGNKLHKGLNIIQCVANNSHYFIYYTVSTVNGKQRVRKLSDFQPITIHIEGGRLNGFFNYIGDNLYTPDKEEDYRYTIARATHPMYDLIGKYVILHFFKDDTPNTPEETTLQLCVKSAFDPDRNPGNNKNYNPVLTMKAWDDMCFAERILMGIQCDEDIKKDFNEDMYSSIINDNLKVSDYEINLQSPYSEYFNNRMMGITMQSKGLYMNATAWRTAYAPGTVSAILSQFPQEGIWGPAHEYGHINQTPMRIAGTTEESNNLFSNVANYYLCKTTSRCNYPSAQLDIFNKGLTYLEHGTWGTTRMFWQLWCYYHATRHNTKFYPRLYELLRNYPLHRDLTSIPGKLNPKTDLLHFAKMCCIAAEEDLTDFFTAWGFFVPQDNYHIDDYDVYDCVLTQEDIDEVKKEIAEFGFPKNNAIILIDDRPNSELPAGFGYDKSKCGQYGGLNDFRNPEPVSGSFSFSLDGNNVTITGQGNPGVGYLVYDNDGNLLGFSNSDTFALSEEATKALLDREAYIVAIDANNNTLEVTNPLSEDEIPDSNSIPELNKDLDINGMINIYDVNGCMIINGAKIQDSEKLSPGIYIIRQGANIKKIIITH